MGIRAKPEARRYRVILPVAILLSSYSIMPLASPSPPYNDGATRTFSNHDFLDVYTSGVGGIGIFMPHPGSYTCLASLYGAGVKLSDFTYYQDDRTALNLKLGTVGAAGLGWIHIGGPCPIPGTPLSDMYLSIPDIRSDLPFSSARVDQRICLTQSFLRCFPEPAWSYMSVYSCLNPSFGSSPDYRHALGGSNLEYFFFSREIACTTIEKAGNDNPELEEWSTYFDGYDGGGTCATFASRDMFFGEGIWGTDVGCHIHLNDHVEYGDGSQYIVSCTETTYDWFDFYTIPPTHGESTARSHDYLLVLDLATPEDWGAAKARHWGNADGQETLALQGWHDYGGHNGCPAIPIDGGIDRYETDTRTTPVNMLGMYLEARGYGELPPECFNGRDDGDGGGNDYLTPTSEDRSDPDCDSPIDDNESA